MSSCVPTQLYLWVFLKAKRLKLTFSVSTSAAVTVQFTERCFAGISEALACIDQMLVPRLRHSSELLLLS